MTEENPDIPQSWDTYWHGADDSAAFSGGGGNHPSIQSFWDGYFRAAAARYAPLRLIDVASGNGAVLAAAHAALDDDVAAFTCLDVSEAAIEMLRQRFPQVVGLVADAASIPLDDGSFDIVTSQFGIEYAGPEAVGEALRLLAPGGQLALLLHHRGGGIYAQCATSRDAIARIQQARFLPLCRDMFEAGFAALRGGDPQHYRAAGGNFAPALRAVESVMTQYGRDVADGTVVRLYTDIRTMHGRMKHYEPTEVLDWLTRMQREVDAFADRMAAMCAVAVDEAGFETLCDRLREHGMSVLRGEPLASAQHGRPLAWVLIAQLNQN